MASHHARRCAHCQPRCCGRVSPTTQVPHFYAAFWGTNNVELYKKIARVIIRSDPLRRKKYKERNVAAYVAYEAPFAMARLAKWKAGEPVSPRTSTLTPFFLFF